jgi:hypothetical protein
MSVLLRFESAMISDVVVAHGQLLPDFQVLVHYWLTVKRPENDSLLVVARIHANPHPLAFARRIISKLDFDMITTSIGGHRPHHGSDYSTYNLIGFGAQHARPIIVTGASQSNYESLSLSSTGRNIL